MLKMSATDLWTFLEERFPQATQAGFVIDGVDEGGVTLVMDTTDIHLRPGGTISGPTLMTLADTGAYLAILSRIGPVALALTTSLEIHFLRRPTPGRLTARTSLVKLGARIAVAQVTIHGGHPEPVAIATVTYALP